MSSRYVVVFIAAATLVAASLPALSQASRLEGALANQSPQRVFQARPEDRGNPAVQAPPRSADRRDQGQRDAHRPPPRDQAQPETHRWDNDHRHAAHRHADDRRHWDKPGPDHRHFGYVVPRPNYYGLPRVYYSPPVAYYGAAPRAYYPYTAAPLAIQLGDYLPQEYRSQQFVVADWEWRGLAAPAYGYQWMLLGPDHFALVAVSTGQIVSLVALR